MKSGIWHINEDGERRHLIETDEDTHSDIESVLKQETDLEIDDGPDRVDMIANIMYSILGTAATSDELYNLSQ
jgi:hypothetical protein